MSATTSATMPTRDEEEHKLSPYELLVLENIARNKARLASLGLIEAKEDLRESIRKKRKPPRKPSTVVPLAKLRRSTRRTSSLEESKSNDSENDLNSSATLKDDEDDIIAASSLPLIQSSNHNATQTEDVESTQRSSSIMESEDAVSPTAFEILQQLPSRSDDELTLQEEELAWLAAESKVVFGNKVIDWNFVQDKASPELGAMIKEKKNKIKQYKRLSHYVQSSHCDSFQKTLKVAEKHLLEGKPRPDTRSSTPALTGGDSVSTLREQGATQDRWQPNATNVSSTCASSGITQLLPEHTSFEVRLQPQARQLACGQPSGSPASSLALRERQASLPGNVGNLYEENDVRDTGRHCNNSRVNYRESPCDDSGDDSASLLTDIEQELARLAGMSTRDSPSTNDKINWKYVFENASPRLMQHIKTAQKSNAKFNINKLRCLLKRMRRDPLVKEAFNKLRHKYQRGFRRSSFSPTSLQVPNGLPVDDDVLGTDDQGGISRVASGEITLDSGEAATESILTTEEKELARLAEMSLSCNIAPSSERINWKFVISRASSRLKKHIQTVKKTNPDYNRRKLYTLVRMNDPSVKEAFNRLRQKHRGRGSSSTNGSSVRGRHESGLIDGNESRKRDSEGPASPSHSKNRKRKKTAGAKVAKRKRIVQSTEAIPAENEYKTKQERGDHVYACWRGDGTRIEGAGCYHPGIVTSVRESRDGKRTYCIEFYDGDKESDLDEIFVFSRTDYKLWIDRHEERLSQGIIPCADPTSSCEWKSRRGWWQTKLTGDKVFGSIAAAMRAYDDEYVKTKAVTRKTNLNIPEEWHFFQSDKMKPKRVSPIANSERTVCSDASRENGNQGQPVHRSTVAGLKNAGQELQSAVDYAAMSHSQSDNSEPNARGEGQFDSQAAQANDGARRVRDATQFLNDTRDMSVKLKQCLEAKHKRQVDRLAKGHKHYLEEWDELFSFAPPSTGKACRRSDQEANQSTTQMQLLKTAKRKFQRHVERVKKENRRYEKELEEQYAIAFSSMESSSTS